MGYNMGMYRYSEETLALWTKPISETEEKKCKNAVSMIKTAIDNSKELNKYDVEVFLQGSYANNTNIRHNSDVDICVMARSVWWGAYYGTLTSSDYGFSASPLNYDNYKDEVYRALCNEFGKQYVSMSNKCIDIAENSYHINADVVPSYIYKNYKIINSTNPEKYIEGIKYFTKDNKSVVNYPKVHLSNGVEKNNLTNHRYKKVVRIMKHILEEMQEVDIVDDSITSFLVECLVFRVPNYYFNNNLNWNDLISNILNYLCQYIAPDWTEVNGIIPIFGSDRKWTFYNVKKFIFDCYRFVFS